jgi:hypothetical protein
MFVAPTARRFGLRVDSQRDERLDVAAETGAAIRLFSACIASSMTGAWRSWPTTREALGSREAIRQTGSRDVWKLIDQGHENDADYVPARDGGHSHPREPDRAELSDASAISRSREHGCASTNEGASMLNVRRAAEVSRHRRSPGDMRPAGDAAPHHLRFKLNEFAVGGCCTSLGSSGVLVRLLRGHHVLRDLRFLITSVSLRRWGSLDGSPGKSSIGCASRASFLACFARCRAVGAASGTGKWFCHPSRTRIPGARRAGCADLPRELARRSTTGIFRAAGTSCGHSRWKRSSICRFPCCASCCATCAVAGAIAGLHHHWTIQSDGRSPDETRGRTTPTSPAWTVSRWAVSPHCSRLACSRAGPSAFCAR